MIDSYNCFFMVWIQEETITSLRVKVKIKFAKLKGTRSRCSLPDYNETIRLVLSLSCLVLSCVGMRCLVSSRLVSSCLVLSGPVLSCLVLSCLVLSMFITWCLFYASCGPCFCDLESLVASEEQRVKETSALEVKLSEQAQVMEGIQTHTTPSHP
jgi:hypothetical protein